MDSFEGIPEFVAVAERQGFSAAAKQLGCSTSHVSRQVSRLEKRLGCALVARTTRLVSLTKVGEEYYQQCRDLVLGLQQANEQVSSQHYQLNGTLRVSAAGTFSEMYIVPALVEFAKLHPELKLDIDFNSRLINFIEDGFDFVIRYGQLTDSGLVARKLVNRSMMAAASSEYLEKHGIPKTPNQLKTHSCLVANNDHWTFEHQGKSISVKVNGQLRSNNAHAIINACKNGLGIAYIPKSNFLTLLDTSCVQPILKPYWSHGSSSWIVYQNRRFLPMRARLAIEFLLDYFSDWDE
jgi:DNA-binding transcriptional LysR family regulator